jgi:hypothetical protein
MVRYLTVDLHTLNASSSERAAILTLRQLIPQFSRSEAIALAAMLIHSYSLSLGRWVGISASRNFNQGLTTAVLQVSALSPATRLGIAIELLKIEAQDDEKKGEEIEYSRGIYHGSDGDDFDPYHKDEYDHLHNNPKDDGD